MCNMSATLLCLQCNGGRHNGFEWAILQEKCASTHSTCTIKRHYLESGKKSAISVSKGASGSITVRWQKTGLSHSHTLKERLASHITVAHTHAISYIDNMATTEAATLDRAATNKTAKYIELYKTHHFIPIAYEMVAHGMTWP